MLHTKIIKRYYGKSKYITILKLEIYYIDIYSLYCKYYFYNYKQNFTGDYASSITRGY